MELTDDQKIERDNIRIVSQILLERCGALQADHQLADRVFVQALVLSGIELAIRRNAARDIAEWLRSLARQIEKNDAAH